MPSCRGARPANAGSDQLAAKDLNGRDVVVRLLPPDFDRINMFDRCTFILPDPATRANSDHCEPLGH